MTGLKTIDYQEIINDLPILIVRFSPKGTITFVNENFCQLFQNPSQYYLGKNIFNLIAPKYQKDIRNSLLSLSPEKSSISFEYQDPKLDEGSRWSGWTGRAIFTEEGILKGYQCIGKDITEKKETELRLNESYEYLGKLNRQISVILSMGKSLEEKNKKGILRSILWSSLELSGANLAILYKKERGNNNFERCSLASKSDIPPKKIHSLEKISFQKNEGLGLFLKNTEQFLCCSDYPPLQNFCSADINHFIPLAFFEKKRLRGVLLLGFCERKDFPDQEKEFFKIFSSYASFLFFNINAFK